MILRDSKRGPFLGCSSFPKCRATRQVAKLEGKVREYVDTLVPALKEGSAKAAEIAAKVGAQFGHDMPVPVATGPITTDIDCDECGKPMMVRSGRRGKFLGCSGYPKCKNTGEVPAKLLEEMGLNGNGAAAAGNGDGQATTKSKKTKKADDELEPDPSIE